MAVRQVGSDRVEVALRERHVVDEPSFLESASERGRHLRRQAAIGELVDTQPIANDEVGGNSCPDLGQDPGRDPSACDVRPAERVRPAVAER